MHFGHVFELSDIDLCDIGFSDTNLNLWETDILSKHFACLQEVLKRSSRQVFKVSSRHVLKRSSIQLTIFRFPVKQLESHFQILNQEKL